jgi:cellulose biosynthesis protein BcsQ
MTEFKILVTSQKGGVGKSTVSANLAAYICRQGKKVALLDYDLHGSSSKWLKGAPQIGIDINHSPLPLEVGGTRPMHEARQKLRRLCYSNEIVIADLTWTDSMTAEFLFEFDMVIVPTSVSEIELNATSEFLQRFRWVFESTIHIPPKLLICPTRVHDDQMSGDSIFKQRFPFRLMLSPAILESNSARKLFQRGFISDLNDACGVSFTEFGSAVLSVVEEQNKISRKNQASTNNSRMQALLRLAAKYEASIRSVA